MCTVGPKAQANTAALLRSLEVCCCACGCASARSRVLNPDLKSRPDCERTWPEPGRQRSPIGLNKRKTLPPALPPAPPQPAGWAPLASSPRRGAAAGPLARGSERPETPNSIRHMHPSTAPTSCGAVRGCWRVCRRCRACRRARALVLPRALGLRGFAARLQGREGRQDAVIWTNWAVAVGEERTEASVGEWADRGSILGLG